MDALDLERASHTIIEFALGGGGRAVHLCNAFTLALASRSHEYARQLNAGHLNLPDGTPLVFIAKRLGISGVSQERRPRGADLLCTTMDRGRSTGIRHFLYGSSAATVMALRERLAETVPGVNIVGTEAPPFRRLTHEEEAETVARIRATDAQIVWVALGTPQQDEFAARFADRVGATFVAVGAAFDFIAGTKRQAPRWMQRMWLEWLFRVVTEPRRLWRRYLVGNLTFLIRAARGTRLIAPGHQARSGPTP